jgi:RimJ/RimL family protein N-acetyltransferase
LATAAGRLLTRWGFERLALRSIFIDREPANLGSAGVAENLGATPIGSRDVTVRGTPITLERYEIVAPGAG